MTLEAEGAASIVDPQERRISIIVDAVTGPALHLVRCGITKEREPTHRLTTSICRLQTAVQIVPVSDAHRVGLA